MKYRIKNDHYVKKNNGEYVLTVEHIPEGIHKIIAKNKEIDYCGNKKDWPNEMVWYKLPEMERCTDDQITVLLNSYFLHIIHETRFFTNNIPPQEIVIDIS